MLHTSQLLLPGDPVVPDQKVLNSEQAITRQHLSIWGFILVQIPGLGCNRGSSFTQHLIPQKSQAFFISGTHTAGWGVWPATGQMLGRLSWLILAFNWEREFFKVGEEKGFLSGDWAFALQPRLGRLTSGWQVVCWL